MTSGFLRSGLFGGLAFRVLLFLSLTLLPIGLVAVLQTQQISQQSKRAAELSLLGVTDQVVATQRTMLQEALGAGRALATVVGLVQDDPRQCSDFLDSYRREVRKYLLVGFVRADGMMECSSDFKTYDLSARPAVQAALAGGVRTVTAIEDAPVSGEDVVVVTVPVLRKEEPNGFVFISIPQSELMPDQIEKHQAAPQSMITFNALGEIVIADGDKGIAASELPASYMLEQLAGDARQVFTDVNQNGVARVYAMTQIVPKAVFALSVWPVDTPMLETDFTGRLSALLPIAMWVASLVVAFWALNRLAITHIRKLGRQMRHFALNRTLPRKPLGENLPVEIVAMEKSFLGMAGSILQDEARQEDSLREKNILLKEVHHRVKNNLQLISSIMNMQIRQAPTEANRRVLQRLQDRILSLATVHKSLYQDNEMTRVDAGILLREIVARSLAVGMEPKAGIRVTEDYDDIIVAPDDAAPLTLLVSEAVTNALKYVPQDQPGKAELGIYLKYTGPEMAMLRVVNTAGGAALEEGTGLGSRLIQAFARQLNGNLELVEEDDKYVLELSFPVPKTDKATNDF
ncbi:sensor histidine kinase [Sulfitobacter sp. HNIBRBA2951]|uniref:sensor histidine kinase n=1 Tax=Sulfitobacter aquimarinus TaxID=3158557 RepID=UPI0032DFBAAE